MSTFPLVPEPPAPPLSRPLVIVVGAGGVGKTTICAALGAAAARAGQDALVMTFDPSLRLKTALGVGDEAREQEVPVALPASWGRRAGRLGAHLLDARRTFDRLVTTYSPNEQAAERILGNRFYDQLSGNLAGIFEYMAVERLYEAWQEGGWQRLFLDTPPTRQALDFLEAPDRILSFLSSSGLKVALRPWFDASGRLAPTRGWGPLGAVAERFLDQLVGLDLLRDMAEFFQAFAPLYAGFAERAQAVQQLLVAEPCEFVLVADPNPERLPDALFFARRLRERGHRLSAMVVNRVHPALPPRGAAALEPELTEGEELMRWLAEHDRRGVAELEALVAGSVPLRVLPLSGREPTDLEALARFGEDLLAGLG